MSWNVPNKTNRGRNVGSGCSPDLLACSGGRTRRLGFRASVWTVALLILLAGAVLPATHTVSSLPYTCSVSGDTLTLSGNLSSTGAAFTIATGIHDVLIDVGVDTISWNTAGAVGVACISTPGTTANYNIEVRGGTFLHSPPSTMEQPDDGLNATFASLGNRHHDFTFRGCKFTIRGHDSQFFIQQGGGYNLEIDSCTFESFRESFTARDQWKLSALNVFLGTVALTTAGLDYTVKFSNNTFIGANWCNLYIEGPTLKALVYGNSFITDGLNTYTVGTFSSCAQNYALSIRYGESGMVGGKSIVNCYDNTFRSGTDHAGGRGIFVSSIDGYSLDPDSSIYIHDNDIEVHQGWDEEERTLNAVIIRQGVSNIYLRDNLITCIGNAVSPSSSYDVGPMACLRITGSPSLDGVKIVGNTCSSYFVGGVTPNYSTAGPNGQDIIFDAYEMSTPNVTIDSNTFASDNVCVRWGFYNGNAGSSVFRNNTYTYLDGDNGYVFQLYGSGGASENSTGNIDRDGTFTGGATATDIYTNDGEPDPMDIALEATLEVAVHGSNGAPMYGATVWIVNAYGDTLQVGTTNGCDPISQVVRYWFQANTAGGADSTGFNNFTLKAKFGTDSVTATYTVAAAAKCDTLVLVNTLGGYHLGDRVQFATGWANEGPYLTAPRIKSWRLGNTLLTFPAQDTNDPQAWWYSLDGGDTYTGVTGDMWSIDGSDMHQATWGQEGIGVHVVAPTSSTTIGYRFIAWPCTTWANAGPIRTVYTGDRTYAAVCAWSDTVAVVIRHSAATNNILIYISTDNFATAGTLITKTLPHTTTYRVGLAPDGAGLPHLILEQFDYGFYYYAWAGMSNGFVGESDSAIVVSANVDNDERAFAFHWADGGFHLVTASSSAQGAIFGWGNNLQDMFNGSGAWARSTVSTTSITDGLSYYPTLTNYGDSLLLIYSFVQGGGDNAAKWFDPVTGLWDVDSLRVDGSDAVYQFVSTPYSVPDTALAIPVYYVTTGGALVSNEVVVDSCTVAAVDSSETVSTPSAPTGDATGDVGEVLTFTAGGSSSSVGHSLEYRFDWDDGTFSTWSATVARTHSYPSAGVHSIKAQARCATDTDIVSAWSAGHNVTLTDRPVPPGPKIKGMRRP